MLRKPHQATLPTEGTPCQPLWLSLPLLTLDGDFAEDLQPLQGGAVPPARVKLVLALLHSQLRSSLHRLHGFHMPTANPYLLFHQPRQTCADTRVPEGPPQGRLLGQVPVRQKGVSVTGGLETGSYLPAEDYPSVALF